MVLTKNTPKLLLQKNPSHGKKYYTHTDIEAINSKVTSPLKVVKFEAISWDRIKLLKK